MHIVQYSPSHEVVHGGGFFLFKVTGVNSPFKFSRRRKPPEPPVAGPVAESLTTVVKTGDSVGKLVGTVIEPPETAEQTTDSENCTDVAILPTPAKHTKQAAPTYTVGGIVPGSDQETEADLGELIVPADQLRRVLTSSNAADLVAAYLT